MPDPEPSWFRRALDGAHEACEAHYREMVAVSNALAGAAGLRHRDLANAITLGVQWPVPDRLLVVVATQAYQPPPRDVAPGLLVALPYAAVDFRDDGRVGALPRPAWRPTPESGWVHARHGYRTYAYPVGAKRDAVLAAVRLAASRRPGEDDRAVPAPGGRGRRRVTDLA